MNGNELWTRPGFDENPASFQVTIRVTDSGGLFLDETFNISVLPADVGLPPIIDDQDLSLNENSTSVTPGVNADDPDAEAGGSFSDTSGGINQTRTASWGAPGPDTVIEHTFTVTFSDSDHARAFFNAGGQIKMTPGMNNATGTAQNIEWGVIVAAAGQFIFDRADY